jgi:saccharopine dehydrogenase (NAD+, L-lysine-forming)
MTWMVYGAYGYTGRLVAALATERGEMPIIAGRDEGKLRALAELVQLDHRVLPLDDDVALRRGLDGVDAVAHCAGPFSSTSRPMVEACLATGTHYLDITGEIDVLEAVLGRHAEAASRGVSLLPGSGFDVVPSDCLAALLAQRLPGATRLALAFRAGGGPSPGSATTMVESIRTPSRARVDGVIGSVPPAWRRRRVPFPNGDAEVRAIAWGDVATAFHSTGIPNVTTYTVLPPVVGAMTALGPLPGALLGNPLSRRMLKALVAQLPGPSPNRRATTGSAIWGEVADDGGAAVQGLLTAPNGYDLTADAVVRIAGLLEKGDVPTGALTPSQALGADFVRQLDGVEVRVPA